MLLAATVTENVPAMVELAVMVMLTCPLPWTATVGPVVIGLEQPMRQLKLNVRPFGIVVTFSVVFPAKPFTLVTVIVVWFEELCLTMNGLGLADIVKSTILTVIVTTWVWAGVEHSPPDEHVPVTSAV